MPKVATAQRSNGTALDAPLSASGRLGSHLRRNQACHQCRKRKSKCDAGRPCSTCTKTHAHYIAPFVARGEAFDPRPTCTYDDDDPTTEEPRSTETLATLMSRTDSGISHPRPGDARFSQPNGHSDSTAPNSANGSGLSSNHSPDYSNLVPESNTSPHSGEDLDYRVTSNIYDRESRPYGFDITTLPDSVLNLSTPSISDSSQSHFQPIYSISSVSPNISAASPQSAHPSTPSSTSHEVLPSSYPPSLPPPYIVEHLVDLFFTSVFGADKILHRQTFLASLREPPGSVKYPSTTLLHAICAAASFSSPIIELPKNDRGLFEMFISQKNLDEEHGLATGKKASFSVEQAVLARAMADLDLRTGTRPIEATIAYLILSWYYYSTGQWADMWIAASIVIRLLVPLGLNVSGNNTIFSSPMAKKAPASWPTTPNDPIRAEQLRNLFWASYILDQHQQLTTCWAPAIVEDDISQELPIRGEDFDAGNHVPAPRQHLSDADLLTNHPPHLTDSWTLYCKVMILMGRIQRFNSRLELQRRAEVFNGTRPASDMFIAGSMLCEMEDKRLMGGIVLNASSSKEIYDSAAFKALENQLTAFRMSIPPQFRDPFSPRAPTNQSFFGGGPFMFGRPSPSVDGNGYMLHCCIASAIIILYSPHANLYVQSDPSTQKILGAAHSILDSVHSLSATSFDLLLLPRNVIVMWKCAAGVLSLFYAVAKLEGQEDVALMYRSEIEVFCQLLARVGEKIPLAATTNFGLKQSLEGIDQMAIQRMANGLNSSSPDSGNPRSPPLVYNGALCD